MATAPDNSIDIAVYLGLIPEPTPPPVRLRDLLPTCPPKPPQLIGGILHKGCKMVLGGTSKSNKSWALLDMATSVASGVDWWGQPTKQAHVLYANFELQTWAICERLESIARAKPGLSGLGDNLSVWNLRGRAADFSALRPELERLLDREEYGLIIIDPVYKLLGGRDENSNGEVADLMNEFERLADRTGAAVVLAHHFAKGDSSAKGAIDRMSGAGAWGRDPDSLLIMTPHEEPDCFTVTSILRNLPALPEFVVEWDFPLLHRRDGLNPTALRTPKRTQKLMSDREFVETFFPDKTAFSRKRLVELAGAQGMSCPTTDRYLARLTASGILGSGGGLYWKP